MTEQAWEATLPPPARPSLTPAQAIIAVGVLACLAIAGANVYEATRPPHHPLSPLALQQLRPVLPAPADPDTFDEARDGSNALSLEDTNGKASIWVDTTSGARIFCLDTCMLLPRTHHQHKIK